MASRHTTNCPTGNIRLPTPPDSTTIPSRGSLFLYSAQHLLKIYSSKTSRYPVSLADALLLHYGKRLALTSILLAAIRFATSQAPGSLATGLGSLQRANISIDTKALFLFSQGNIERIQLVVSCNAVAAIRFWRMPERSHCGFELELLRGDDNGGQVHRCHGLPELPDRNYRQRVHG